MVPIGMWRVENSDGHRGTLTLCQKEGGVLSTVFVRDGMNHKDVDEVLSWSVFDDVVIIEADETLRFRLLSEIPISEGTEKISVVTVTAAVRPSAKTS